PGGEASEAKRVPCSVRSERTHPRRECRDRSGMATTRMKLSCHPLLIPFLDPQVAILDPIDLGLQGEGTLLGDLPGGFEEFVIAGAPGLGAGDDHFDGVPVAVLVVLERLVRADPRVVADLELMRENLVAQVKAAIRIPGGAEFQAEGEVAVIRF